MLFLHLLRRSYYFHLSSLYRLVLAADEDLSFWCPRTDRIISKIAAVLVYSLLQECCWVLVGFMVGGAKTDMDLVGHQDG